MNNNDENPENIDELSNEKPNTSKTRMIQIPVQHFPATSRNTPSEDLNMDKNFTERVPHFYSDRFESGSPFGSPSLFNQNNRYNFKHKDPFDRRFPFTRLPDRDDFFDHVDLANNPTESFFRYNSPERSSLFDRLRSNSRSNTPPTSSTLRNRFDTNVENSPIRQTEGQQQQPNANNQNSPNNDTNYYRPNLNQPASTSNAVDELKRTDSPKRFATYANVQPNYTDLSTSNSSSRIPIQVEHISNSPQRSDSNSTFEKNLLNQNGSANNSNKSEFVRNNNSQPNDKESQRASEPAVILTERTENSTESIGTNMGSTMSNPNNTAPNFNAPKRTQTKPTTITTDTSDFVTAAANAAGMTNATNSKSTAKTAQEKCDDIQNELNNLERDVDNFVGKHGDKNFNKLDELLTRCLLKLDEIDRSDDKIKQLCKNLINSVHKLSDKLEVRANGSYDSQTVDNSNSLPSAHVSTGDSTLNNHSSSNS